MSELDEETTARYMDTADLYERAMKAEPALRPIERMIIAFCAMAPSKRSGKPFCYACVWELILKPMILPLVGDGRGYPTELQEDEYQTGFTDLDWRNLPGPIPAESRIEKWLRTSEAYDTVTNRWIRMLEDVDPARGHGIPGVYGGHR